MKRLILAVIVALIIAGCGSTPPTALGDSGHESTPAKQELDRRPDHHWGADWVVEGESDK